MTGVVIPALRFVPTGRDSRKAERRVPMRRERLIQRGQKTWIPASAGMTIGFITASVYLFRQ